MKCVDRILLIVCLISPLYGYSCSKVKRDILFQTSTINALLEGIYDGDVTFEELRKCGDFGLGTVNGLDGELVVLDGKFYQVRSDGIVNPIDNSMKTPFAVVTFHEADKTVMVNKSLNLEQFESYLNSILPSQNIFYAIRIDGTFRYIKVRSVPRQERPYQRLVDIVKNQPTFEFHDMRGTIVAFWLPEYINGINVPGYHFHFLTEDRKSGGHLLSVITGDIRIQIDYTSEIHMVLPESKEFSSVDLTKEKQKELESVEK